MIAAGWLGNFMGPKEINCWSHWPYGLRRRSLAARMLRLWVRIPPGVQGRMSVVSVVCVVR